LWAGVIGGAKKAINRERKKQGEKKKVVVFQKDGPQGQKKLG